MDDVISSRMGLCQTAAAERPTPIATSVIHPQ
jgi:hypothetical protein